MSTSILVCSSTHHTYVMLCFSAGVRRFTKSRESDILQRTATSSLVPPATCTNVACGVNSEINPQQIDEQIISISRRSRLRAAQIQPCSFLFVQWIVSTERLHVLCDFTFHVRIVRVFDDTGDTVCNLLHCRFIEASSGEGWCASTNTAGDER